MEDWRPELEADGSHLVPADMTMVIINWWPRSQTHRAMSELSGSLKRSLSMVAEQTDANASASAAVNSAPAETGTTAQEMAVPTTSNSESSETLDSSPKRMRCHEDAHLPEKQE